jgi:hypothetical protein
VIGTKVGEVTIDGQTCNQFFFLQPPGIELELCSEANEGALPRQIAITYRSIHGEPQMLAEMANWKLGFSSMVTPLEGEGAHLPSPGTQGRLILSAR